MKVIVIYPGRFHPFHKGHKSVYDTLIKRFGKQNVFISTSNKIDPPKSPFSFEEKRAMMALTGIDPSRVVQVKNPYQATEITASIWGNSIMIKPIIAITKIAVIIVADVSLDNFGF